MIRRSNPWRYQLPVWHTCIYMNELCFPYRHSTAPLKHCWVFFKYSQQTTDTNSSIHAIMMTSSNGNIFRVIGPLCGEFTGRRRLPRKRPVTRSFDVFLISAWINGWVNNREAGDLRHHRAHYDVIVMVLKARVLTWFLTPGETIYINI